jgi:hypothetical protein
MNAKQNGDQYKVAQMAKNTVYVDIADGTATTSVDDHLREAAEARVHYVPEADVWLPKPVSGATVKCAILSWLL